MAPSDFVPSEFGGAIHLAREKMGGNMFWGPPPNGNANTEALPSGPDTGVAAYRDDDPQSGGSVGVIYDLDTPGFGYLFTDPTDRIRRIRHNFKAWAEYDGTRCSEKKEWYSRQSCKLTGLSDPGTATSATANTLTDNNKNWTPDTWAPGVIKITGGTAAGEVRRITANTATTITVATNWGTQPDATSKYTVINTSTRTLLNDVAGDNQNGDGTTNITWDLQ